MARDEGKQRDAEARRIEREASREVSRMVPDLMRRAIAMGLAGFFTTEEAFRRALGDTVPRDWVDFAAAQGERTRGEIADRLANEFGRVLEQVDLAALASSVLEGHTVEVTARIRLLPRDEPDDGGSA